MFRAHTIAFLLLAVPSQLPAQPATRCVPVRVSVDGGGPLPLVVLTLAGSASRTSVMFSPTNPPEALLLPTDERRVSLSSSMPEGYRLSVLTYGSTNLLQEPLHVSNGDVADLVIRFSAAPGSWTQVSGRVTGVDLSARDYFVSLDGSGISRRRVAPDGSFAFLTVLRGTRTISLQSSGGIPVSMPLVVGSEPLSGVEVVSPPQREVNGLVVTDGGGASYYSFSLILKDGTRQQTISPSPTGNGTFRMALPLGEHQVTLGGLPEGAVRSFTYGDANLLTGPLRVSPGDTSQIRITVAAPTRPIGVPGGVIPTPPGSCVIQTPPGVPPAR